MHHCILSNHTLRPDDMEIVIKSNYSLDSVKYACEIIRKICRIKPDIQIDTSTMGMFNIGWLCSIVLRIGYEMGRKDRRKK